MSNVAEVVPEKRTRETNFDPERKLYIPEGSIPGYVLYWFRGEPGRLNSALRKGWEYVTPEEAEPFLPAFSNGTDAMSGNSDMGSKVSSPAQEGTGPDGQYLRLYLMKLKKEYWDEDMEKYIQNRIEPIVETFKSGMVGEGQAGETSSDKGRRYRPKGAQLPAMFTRKPNKA